MKKSQEKIIFIGRPFADQLMDEQRTYTQSNIEMEQDEVFQEFLAINQLTNNRSNLIIFGPENFMYWYGVTVTNEVEVPQGLMKFVLPQAEVAIEEIPDQNLSYFSQPLNSVLPPFFQKISNQGIPIYENPGDSSTPYFLQELNLITKKLTQMIYLKASN
jgi:hypothetical protein